jgi:phosphate starvation-inducible membrane PsiE
LVLLITAMVKIRAARVQKFTLSLWKVAFLVLAFGLFSIAFVIQNIVALLDNNSKSRKRLYFCEILFLWFGYLALITLVY